MASPSIETVRGWVGRVMVDRDGDKIGEVVDIYLDNQTDRPDWAVVRTGLFGLRSSFVPLAQALQVGDELQVPHQRLQVKQAPNIDPDGQLSAAEEAELYRHYGLDYDTLPASGAPVGQPGTGAAGRADPPARPDPPGATGVPEPASPATGELADPGPDGEAGRGPVAAAGPDRLPVGEGVSRPFVYQTPARPEAGPGRGQPGQVRLRRYLVTEVVTETEAGQRHELRVQSEPVSEAEVAAVPAAPDDPGDPIGQDPNRPQPNDWFDDQTHPQH